VKPLRPPWESEEAAFSWLLRILAVCVAIAVLSLLVKSLT
jgi:hypothetical protein